MTHEIIDLRSHVIDAIDRAIAATIADPARAFVERDAIVNALDRLIRDANTDGAETARRAVLGEVAATLARFK